MLRFILNFIIAMSFACFLNASPLLAGDKSDNSEQQMSELDSYPSPVGGFGELMQHIVYPESGKKSGVEGKVLLMISFDEQATILKVEVVESLGKELDEAAIEAVKKVQWKPAMSNDKPVECEIHLPIKFALEDKKKDKK